MYEPFAPEADLVPNVADFGNGYHVHVTGLIHDETGFPVGSPKVTQESIHRLHQKINRAGNEIIHTEEYFMEDADFAVVSFGGTARTVYEAVSEARELGYKVGMLRLVTIWPFQASPMTPTGKKATTAPYGSVDRTFDACSLAQAAFAPWNFAASTICEPSSRRKFWTR